MATTYQHQQVIAIVTTLNKRFNIAIRPEEFNREEYSASSLRDMLIQRVNDELSGEWTTEKAMAVLRGASPSQLMSFSEISPDMALEKLLPAGDRRKLVREWSDKSGLELDILRPARLPQGILIFIVFAAIPLGIGMDWFLSAMLIALSLAALWLLSKTASHLKFVTFEEMAEAIAWQYYLKQQKGKAGHTSEGVEAAVRELIP
jgi:hypothetical protein